jgi:hypothetical protein
MLQVSPWNSLHTVTPNDDSYHYHIRASGGAVVWTDDSSEQAAESGRLGRPPQWSRSRHRAAARKAAHPIRRGRESLRSALAPRGKVLIVEGGPEQEEAGATDLQVSVELVAECERFISEHKKKADVNEKRARIASWLLVGSTAAIPVFIVASTQTLDFTFGKLIPAVLAAISAAVAGLLQFERPHERWSLYRRYQRMGEAEKSLYLQRAGQYRETERDLLFSEVLANLKLSVHDEWAGLVPASDQVARAKVGNQTNGS